MRHSRVQLGETVDIDVSLRWFVERIGGSFRVIRRASFLNGSPITIDTIMDTVDSESDAQAACDAYRAIYQTRALVIWPSLQVYMTEVANDIPGVVRFNRIW